MSKTKKRKTNYFGKPVEQAILEYQKITQHKDKQAYFVAHLYKPFCRLIDGILQGFKFDYISESKEDLIQEGIAFLLDGRLEMFKGELGTKAYSYFGTALKRYFIVRNADAYKKLKSHIPINTIHADSIIEVPSWETNQTENITFTFSDTLNSIFEDNQEEIEIAQKIIKVCEKNSSKLMYKKSLLYIEMSTTYGINKVETNKILKKLKNYI